jgi:hypothetical protein
MIGTRCSCARNVQVVLQLEGVHALGRAREYAINLGGHDEIAYKRLGHNACSYQPSPLLMAGKP